MENQKFSTLARAFFGRRNHNLRDVPAAIEIESDECLLRAAPHPQDEHELTLSVHFLSAEHREAFFSPRASKLMHQMNANARLSSDWRYVISLQSDPHFVAHLDLITLDLSEFEMVIEKGLTHAGAMLALTSFDWSNKALPPSDLISDVTVIRG